VLPARTERSQSSGEWSGTNIKQSFSNFSPRRTRYFVKNAVCGVRRGQLNDGLRTALFCPKASGRYELGSDFETMHMLALHFFGLPDVSVGHCYKPAPRLGVIACAGVSIALPSTRE
jgi:hypothetical protein